MSNYPNIEETKALIKDLVTIPSPTGYTKDAIQFIENRLAKSHVQTKRNRKGGLIATLPGKDTRKHRFLTAHVDTLGAIVKEIKDNGRLKIQAIGGFPFNFVEGEYCTIHTVGGEKITGTILMHQTAVHVYRNTSELKRDTENIEVRVDAVVKSEEDTRKLGIEVGDFISFDPRVETTDSGFIKSRHLDDKASVAILINVIEKLVADQTELPYTTHFLFSNNEEIGYGGNSNIPPETVEYLAVDMGAIGDGQRTDEYTVSICVKDASGPYHYGLRNHLTEIAKANQIDYKLDIYPYYQSDASAAIHSGHDIIHGLIGPGIDASHAFERTHESSLKHTENLVYHYVQSEMVEE
ncbi:M42 family metallopeptidase [Oceanobacillus sp. J11TS1]|uniref:M42 family metallopeptidase n=1 Tax=Oceanobacillus sp. J11TS1 TaxID=2807191 RepID=UPI001B0BFD7C|nr:M42 family metallopeptidase [Oceanobacillus sp. J11TS1]GIO24713.1 putative aminopeptidase YhfE [Oceanobacillus sp. J11TS1]